MEPTLSIITTCFNAEKSILRTLNSIRELKSLREDIEYIVQDGSSEDNTVKIIKENLDIIDHFSSEKDEGIYDGMNKAVDQCTGKYLLFINADDTVIPEGLKTVTDELTKESFDFIACDVEILNSSYESIGQRKARLEPLGFGHSGMPCSHQGFICKTEFFNKLGRYSNNFKIAGDYEFIVRCLNQSQHFRNIKVQISRYPLGGISYGNVARWENFRIQMEHVSLINSLKNLSREFISVFIQKILPNKAVQLIKKIKESQYSYIPKK